MVGAHIIDPSHQHPKASIRPAAAEETHHYGRLARTSGGGRDSSGSGGVVALTTL